MKKKLCAILVIAVVMLSGCTTEYEKKDIESYVKEKLALENYTVSDTWEESEDEDGYTDRIWTVVDEENDITFHVLDDYHWGAESLTNVLDNDYEGTVFRIIGAPCLWRFIPSWKLLLLQGRKSVPFVYMKEADIQKDYRSHFGSLFV